MSTRRTTEHLPFGEKRDPRFFGQDILSVDQFDRADLETIFAVAHEMYGMVERIGTFDLLKGKVLTNLFYEPSTRTSSSFIAAIDDSNFEAIEAQAGADSVTTTILESSEPYDPENPDDPRDPDDPNTVDAALISLSGPESVIEGDTTSAFAAAR